VSAKVFCGTLGPQAKSKKLMWRMNKGIVKDLLPQSPRNIQIGAVVLVLAVPLTACMALLSSPVYVTRA
jgi:hypothetical protein